jgi:hypothetical protein
MFKWIHHTTVSSSSYNKSCASPPRLLNHLLHQLKSISSAERSSSSLSIIVHHCPQQSSCEEGSFSFSLSLMSNHLAARYTKLHQDGKVPHVTVSLEIVQDLLLGNLDPFEFAQDNLPPEHVAAVIHLKRDLHQKR